MLKLIKKNELLNPDNFFVVDISCSAHEKKT